MKLFENYINGIDSILQNKSYGEIRKANESYLPLSGTTRASGTRTFSFSNQVSKIGDSSKALLNIDINELETYFGKNKLSFSTISIGPHPDFNELNYNESEKHYCVSMFVDIKGSTRLALTHSLEEVRLIKDSLLTLCIQVANFFGGHVHRLQGDAAFIQFVRKGEHPNDSIINALNAASVLCQFVSSDLSTIFEQNNLNPIKIRVGLDYGRNDEVLWSYYGIKECNELTTTSLHTDLAAKLQAQATNNSIRIGKNVVDALDLPSEFYSIPKKVENGAEFPDYYILKSPQLNYKQFVFDWQKYLNTFDFYKKNNNGLLEINKNTFTINCFIGETNESVNSKYYQNSFSIPKGYKIKYNLLRNGIPYHRASFDTIVWEAENRGVEAINDEAEKLDFNGVYNNQTCCMADAAYLGHHYLICKIKREHEDNIVIKFPIFVQ
ncbi:MAG: adenylate/guanylate cyclase domain-containing protein [Acholeplasma sp.]|nr:adenylate/guanylate cyclase domain-containing protein [Acholeplasma sp.]